MKILFTPSQEIAAPKPAPAMETPEAVVVVEPRREAPAPIIEVAPPPDFSTEELENKLQKKLDELKANLVTEWKQWQKTNEPVPHAAEDLVRQNSLEIAKLSEQVEGMRKMLVELQMQREIERTMQERKAPPAPAPVSVSVPVPIPVPEPVKPLPVPPEPVATIPLKPMSDVPAAPERGGLLDALTGPVSSEPVPETPERKVAFITKLWDYLNHTAYEIPIRKTNQPR